MALQNYKERTIGCHVILRTNEEDMAKILIGLHFRGIVHFSEGDSQTWKNGAVIKRLSTTDYRLDGYEPFEVVNSSKIPKDLLELVEFILENNLYDSMSFRHDDEGLKEEIIKT